jgi:hypothetical protein
MEVVSGGGLVGGFLKDVLTTTRAINYANNLVYWLKCGLLNILLNLFHGGG